MMGFSSSFFRALELQPDLLLGQEDVSSQKPDILERLGLSVYTTITSKEISFVSVSEAPASGLKLDVPMWG
jgi:hypothetical protein